MNNKKIYFDITTSYYWQGNDVGIIRVEKAIARILLNHLPQQVIFCVLPNKTERFEIVSNDIVLDIISSRFIYRDLNGRFWDTFKRFTAHSILLKIKRILKKVIHTNYHGACSTLLHDIKKFIYCISAIKQENNRQKKYKINVQDEKLVNFQKNDIYISLGLDWDKENMPIIFQLKKDIGIKTILYCYDLIVLKFPQFVPLAYSCKLSNYFYELLWSSDYIIAISESTKNDLIDYAKLIGANIPKVEVVNIGCNLVTPSNAEIEFDSKHLLINQDFVISVSTFDPRKNYQLLYNVWHKFYADNVHAPKLVLVGRNGWLCNDLLSMINNDVYLSKQVIVIHDATDQVLNWLYNNCLFTLFPSFYEGWGIPVAESLYYNKYCLASNQGSIPEVAQGLLELLDPLDFYGWYNSIRDLFEHRDKLALLEQKIKLNYKCYTLDKMSADFMKFLYDKFNITAHQGK